MLSRPLLPLAHLPVEGDLRVFEGVPSPGEATRTRDVLVHLPPSYGDGDRRYPVVYMHDGQNLFDPAASFAGSWYVDRTMAALADQGIEAIVVGIPNAGAGRLHEYTPFRDRRHGGGGGDDYLEFLRSSVKPLVDARLRTLPGPATTIILGSSLGGLISLYALFRHADVFGGAGVLSPSLFFADGEIFRFLRRAPEIRGRIHLDIGGAEGRPSLLSRLTRGLVPRDPVRHVRRLKKVLEARGFHPGRRLSYVEEREGRHNEAAWARRLPGALAFLLATP